MSYCECVCSGCCCQGLLEAPPEDVKILSDHPVHMVPCADPYCIDGTSSDGRKDDGSKWEEGPHGDCDHCWGTGLVAFKAGV